MKSFVEAPTQQANSCTQELVAETLHGLRYKPVNSTTLERLRITRQADERVRGLPQPLQLGEGLHFILSHIDAPVSPNDLLAGRISEEVPDAEGEAFFQESVRHLSEPGGRQRAVPLWMQDGGHECFAWDRLLTHGLVGLQRFAEEQLIKRESEGAGEATLDFLRGAIRVYEAHRVYARRNAEAARNAGMAEMGAWCEAAATRAPRTFPEALQLMLLVGHVFCTMTNSNPTLPF
jgi:hypothetical protein